jgi:hypothetical protein
LEGAVTRGHRYVVVLSVFIALVVGAAGFLPEHVSAQAVARPISQQAGYGSVSSAGTVGAHWVVPPISCPASGYYWMALQTYLVGSNNEIAQAETDLSCYNGTASYAAFAVVNGVYSTFDVVPGDNIVALIKLASSGASAKVSDTTSGVSKTVKGSGSVSNEFFVGDTSFNDMFGGPSPSGIPTFTKNRFTNVTVGGQPLSASDTQPTYMVDASHQVMVKASSLNSAGNGFSCTFVRDS